jgi:hypothetical protein
MGNASAVGGASDQSPDPALTNPNYAPSLPGSLDDALAPLGLSASASAYVDPTEAQRAQLVALLSNSGDGSGSLPALSPADTDPLPPSPAPADNLFPGSEPGGLAGPFYASAGRGGAYLDTRGAGPEDGALLSLVGNPANPRLRREWEKLWDEIWPRDPVTGQRYDVAHIIAKADGGKDHVDNIRPMLRAEHHAEHRANGDYARWARRARIAGAFGGTVARAFPMLNALSDITGILSGRIRTDNFDNFAHDMTGTPSKEDLMKEIEKEQKEINPNWKPGDPIVEIA